MTYDADSYWRHQHEHSGLVGVGHSNLPDKLNRWFYRAAQRSIAKAVEGLRPRTVFDVGAGTGYWTEWWSRRGASVDGCDLVPAAVEALRSKFPGTFTVNDVGESLPPGAYDLVSVMSVLLHVMDERRFEQALKNVSGLVAPGGHLLLVEPLQVGRYRRGYRRDGSSMARPAPTYLEPMRASGLELRKLTGLTAFCSDPIEARSRLAFEAHLAAWRASKVFGRLAPDLVGRALYSLDRPALRTGWAPSAKVVLMQRPEQPR